MEMSRREDGDKNENEWNSDANMKIWRWRFRREGEYRMWRSRWRSQDDKDEEKGGFWARRIERKIIYITWYCRDRVSSCNIQGVPGGNVPDFGRMFLTLKYTDITQNTYIRSWTVTEILAREVWKYDSCYTLIDYQIHIKTARNM